MRHVTMPVAAGLDWVRVDREVNDRVCYIGGEIDLRVVDRYT